MSVQRSKGQSHEQVSVFVPVEMQEVYKTLLRLHNDILKLKMRVDTLEHEQRESHTDHK